MKHILASLLVILVSIPIVANDGGEVINNSSKTILYNSIVDPGHKHRSKKDMLNKDRSPLELYLGISPYSLGVKLNTFGGSQGNLTETLYVMTEMDFEDSDIHAKVGINLNGKKQYNQTKVEPLIRIPAFKKWRYIQWRHSIELGYKTHFLDPEETTQEKLVSTNYGGLTIGYSWIGDALDFLGIRLLRPSWYSFDMRTARRIRTKLDVGFFFNFDKFNPSHIGFPTIFGTQGESNGTDFNENIPDDSGSDDFDASNYNPNFGQPLEMPTYPVLSLYFNVSIGIALW